jgi:uncharacterized protein (DUF1810 family)
MADPDDLERFVAAQDPVIATVIAELAAGRKQTHWMWFVFPQLRGLGHSSTALFYGLDSVDEARAYLAHPILAPRLRQCTETVLSVQGRSLHAIFGSPDDVKFRSSMTLFERAAGEGESLFSQALDRLCEGSRDPRTLALLDER